MGIWKEIKYALNNTLGTSYFVPLNEILGRELVASDNLYINTGIKHSVSLSADNESDTFTYSTVLVRCNGSVKVALDGSFYGYDGASNRIPYYELTINVMHTDGTSNQISTEYYPDETITTLANTLSVKQGDRIAVTLYGEMKGSDWGTAGMKYNGTLKLYADVTQSSLVEVL